MEGAGVVELTPKSPLDGMAPLAIGTVTLSEVAPGRLTSVAPYKGRAAALSEALQAAHGLAAPGPNRATGGEGARAIGFGREMFVLQGPAPDAGLAEHAALTDQSDGWAVLWLEGAGAADVLARLCPLDMRASVFGLGHTARTELAHMMGAITRTGEAGFQIMVFRSVAQTALHELQLAMEGVAARARP